MTAKIAGLTRYVKKGAAGESLSEANLLEGIGMEGDMHQGGAKQLSLLSADVRGWMDSCKEPGLCFKKFRENILIDGVNFKELTNNSRLSIGEAVLSISMGKKHCYDECDLRLSGLECRLSGNSVFAVVEHGGTVRIGDTVKIK